ncbi:hypothetical protein LPJ72_006224, partial [Coemansia sp. Benny D160-2]
LQNTANLMRVDSDTTSDSSATAATATGSRFLRDGGSSGTPTIGAMGVKLNQFKSSLGSLLTRSSSTLRVPDHALNQHQSIHSNNNNAPQSQTVSKTMCAEPLVSPGVFGIVGDKAQLAAPSMPLSTAPIRPRMAMAQALFVDTKHDNEGPLDRELPPLPSTAVPTSRGGALRQNTAAATGIPRPLPPSSSSSSNAPYARSAVPRVARLASAPSVQRSNTVGATSSRRIVPPSRSHQQRQASESEAESAAQLAGPSVVAADPRGAAPMDYSSSTDTDEDSGIAAATASMMASGGLVAANRMVDVKEEEQKEGGPLASGSSAMAVPARPTANGAVCSMEPGHPPAEAAADPVSEDCDGSAASSDVSMAEAPSVVDSIAMDDQQQQQQQQGSGLVDSSNAKDLDNAFGSSVGKDTVDSSSSSAAAALGSLGIQSMANISPRLSLRLSSDASTFGFGLSALASLISSDDASAAEAVEEEAVVAPAGPGESKDAEAAAARVSDEVDSDRMSLDAIEDTQQQSEPRGSVPAKEEEAAPKEPSAADKAREEEDMENPIHARLR